MLYKHLITKTTLTHISSNKTLIIVALITIITYWTIHTYSTFGISTEVMYFLFSYLYKQLLSTPPWDEPQALHKDNYSIILCIWADLMCSSCMWLWMSDYSVTQYVLKIHKSGCNAVLMVTWLVPHKTAAVSVHILWTQYNHAPAYSVTTWSHICRVPAHLAE